MRPVIVMSLTWCLSWFITPMLALAQDDAAPPPAGAETSATSYFKMFFLSGDILGLIIIWTLLLMSLVAIALIISFMMKYRRSTMVPEETQQQMQEMLEEKRYREAIEYANEDPSYLGKLLAAAMGEASNGFGAMERAVEESADVESSRMLRPIEILNIMGNISPMMGLFGTVYGMIVAFNQLVSAGGKPDPVELADGISTALVTTFWGLVVAIPALAAYALIRNRIDAMAGEGLLAAEELIATFRPAKRSGSSSSSSGSSAGSSSGGGSSQRPRATPKPSDQ